MGTLSNEYMPPLSELRKWQNVLLIKTTIRGKRLHRQNVVFMKFDE